LRLLDAKSEAPYTTNMPKEKILQSIEVVYTHSFGHPSQSDAFMRLEQIVPLKGHRFYATYDARTQEYCACAKIKSKEEAQTFRLPVKTIEGGWYASVELEGPYLEIIQKIGATFDALAKQYTVDSTRLPIEFYKRHTHIVLYLPIPKSDAQAKADDRRPSTAGLN
jgi:hypothetical protein